MFERFLDKYKDHQSLSQQLLFPRTLTLTHADTLLLKELIVDINKLGFDIQEFGSNSFVIHGLPSELDNKIDENTVVEDLLEQFKTHGEVNSTVHEKIALFMAKKACLKKGIALNAIEMKDLIDQLFACAVPFRSPSGKNCFVTMELDDIENQFFT